MSETTQTEQSEAQDDTQEPQGPAQEVPEADEAGKAGREAARYRTRLREAEAQRDTLAARVEAMQRAEVARLAGARLSQGADVFDVGRVDLADLLDEDGAVDTTKVENAVADLLTGRPGLSQAAPWPAMGQGQRGAVTGGEKSWDSVLKGR